MSEVSSVKIGEKIKNLRMSKMMTQAELVGDNITRNMLSRIENGTALPSLSTLIYIAGRLNVPAGYLIAEEDNETIYRKINCMDNIRRAYNAGEYRLCRTICLRELDHADDEIALILAESCLAVAKEEMSEGRLRSACSYLDEALTYAAKTMYTTSHITSCISVYFRYLGEKISNTLYSMHDLPRDDCSSMLSFGDGFCRYIVALESLEAGNAEFADRIAHSFSASDGCYAACIHACIRMSNGMYAEAAMLLRAVLDSDESIGKLLLFDIIGRLEICTRETGDYKSAYEFSSSKVRLLEKMLEEANEI